MATQRTVGDKGLSIGQTLKKISRMVASSTDKRATALAELKQSEGGDPFKILIGTVLSHRTRDESTSKATERLFEVYDTPQKLANADFTKVRDLIRSVGFYNMKARNVIKVARQVLEEFGGRVPDDLESLLSLHAVGRKTANCVLVYGFGKPAIPVDTHVHRIANRLGIVKTKTPEETEEELMKKIPKRYWLELNELFVRFGQTTCKPVSPHCQICTLTADCVYYKQVVEPRLRTVSRPSRADRTHYRETRPPSRS